MDANRDVLFGILAGRIKNMDETLLARAVAIWKSKPGSSLATVFLDEGLIPEEEGTLFNECVDVLLARHGGDSAAAMASLEGTAWLETMLRLAQDAHSLASGISTVPEAGMTPAEDPADSRFSGTEMIGRYTFKSTHARGGMGQVLLVHDHHMQRDVAFKELLPRLDKSSAGENTPIQHSGGLVMRFLQEARVTAQLEHPSIVPVYELGRRLDGTLYYTMKLVKGDTLLACITRCKNLGERLALLGNFLNLCHAIAYAHSRGVIHRDIKPNNVMVGQFGETVVLDWGLAKVKDKPDINCEEIEEVNRLLAQNGDFPQTAYGRAMGTPHYMPPEQAQGWTDLIDERSDVYSLGAVLYEIITGTTPYTGKSSQDIVKKRCDGPPRPPLTLAPEAPPELASICGKAIQTERQDRYQSAIEMAEDIQRFITGSLVKAYSYTPREMLAYYYRRNRVALNTLAASAIVLLAVAVYSYLNILNARNLAEHTNYVNQLALTQEYIGRQDYLMANQTLDQAQPKERGWEWGYLKNRANPDLWTVETAPERICLVALSPDGAIVATVADSGKIQTWDAATGKPKTTFENSNLGPYSPPKFSPDGSALITAGTDDKSRIWAVTSGKLRHVLGGNQGQAVYAAFSPDGAEAVTTTTDGSVRFWDARTGAARDSIKASEGHCIKALYTPDGATLVTVSDQKEIVSWNRAGLTERFRMPGNDAVVNHDGRWLAVLQQGNAVLVEIDTGRIAQTLCADAEINRLRFSRAGDRVLTGSADGQVRLFNTQSGALLREFVQKKSEGNRLIDEVAFAEKDSVVVAWDRANNGYVWDTDTGNRLNQIAAGGQYSNQVDFACDGRRIVIAGSENFFQCLDPLYQTGRTLLNAGGRSPACATRIAVSEATGTVALLDRSIQLQPRDAAHPGTLFAVPALDRYSYAIAFSPAGNHVAFSTDAFCPSLWNTNLSSWASLQGHRDIVHSMAFDASGQRLATASLDTTACLWDAASGKNLQVLRGHEGPVYDAQFSPDGRLLVTASMDRTAALWETATGKRLHVFEDHQGAVKSASFDPSGSRIYTAAEDGNLRMWDVSSGVLLEVAQAHNAAVYQMQRPTGAAFLVTDNADGVTRLWNPQPLKIRLALPGFLSPAFSGVREQLLGTHRDGLAEAWEAVPWQENETTAFDLYRSVNYQRNKDALLPEPAPEKLILTTSNRVLTLAMDALLAASQTQDASGKADAFAFLGLQETDDIVAVESTRAATPGDTPALYQQLRAAAQQLPAGHWTLRLRRGTTELPLELWIAPVQEIESSVTLTRDEAKRLLQGLKNGLTLWESVRSVPGEEDVRLDLLRQKSGLGLSLSTRGSEVPTTESLAFLRKAHILAQEGIVAADAVGATDGTALFRYLEELESKLENNASTGFTLETQAGSFLHHRIKYTVQ